VTLRKNIGKVTELLN